MPDELAFTGQGDYSDQSSNVLVLKSDELTTITDFFHWLRVTIQIELFSFLKVIST
ncbi:hypothetical protein [Endozoicomonas sp. ALC020]|uniref:hypothetical protein n=1 Tax=unclassified Endozoicomonas TaxID=2644528 RepID=UPI003BAE32CF